MWIVMVSLGLAALFFIVIHLGWSGTTLRDRAVAAIGLCGYMVAFSVASLAAIIWLVSAYKAAAYVPTWGQLEWWKPFAIALMLPAFLLVVIGLTTPNPTAVAQEALVDRPPSGIVRVTRHPFLIGVAIWAAVHLIGNGDLASLLFFAAMTVVAAAGTVSIDARRSAPRPGTCSPRGPPSCRSRQSWPGATASLRGSSAGGGRRPGSSPTR